MNLFSYFSQHDPLTSFQDGESGWSSLHRALHFGHLAVASVLLQSGASLVLEDSKGRTPVDLLSGPVLQVVGNGPKSGMLLFVYDWCPLFFKGLFYFHSLNYQ